MIHFILTQLASMRKQRMVNCQNASCKQKSAESKVFNDPIHGHIELPEICVKIINTPEFLRLRNIKQLGATYLVFPGAAHNRFEHCIGVSHLAGEFGRHLRDQIDEILKKREDEKDNTSTRKENEITPHMKITERDIICLQVAGLCHDIGHGPMSHAFESRFIRSLNPTSKWEHEKASRDMFDHLLDKHKEITIIARDKEPNKYTEDEKKKLEKEEKEDREFIKNLIHRNTGDDWKTGRKSEKEFLYEIVANKKNGIDVDKFDYFARDCYHLGFKNNFDHKRLIKFSRVIYAPDKAWHICYRDKQVEDIYHMFLSRVILHRRACQHKTVAVLERMYMDALKKANNSFRLQLRNGKSFKISETPNDMEAYTILTDNVFNDIRNCQKEELKEAQEILDRIETRDLYKLVGEAILKPGKIVKDEALKDEEAIVKGVVKYSDQLKEEDLLADIADFNYGKKDKNPVDSVYFYNKPIENGHYEAFRIKREDVSGLLPSVFAEKHIRLYVKDPTKLGKARECFIKWCGDEDRKLNGKWKHLREANSTSATEVAV